MQPRTLLPIVTVFVLGLFAPGLGSAQMFLDFYVGAAITSDARVTVQRVERSFCLICFPPSTSTTTTAIREADFGPAVGFGGRVGYWFERAPMLGLALDVSPFQAKAWAVDATVIPVSFLVMLRLPLLVGGDFAKGRLQPYAAVGPRAFTTDISVDARPELPSPVSESTRSKVGLDARAGVAWHIQSRLAIFGEYRFAHTPVDARTTDGSFARSVSTTIETRLDTNALLAGLSFRF